jgi:hypothetical protein
MSYTIRNTDGSIRSVVEDGSVDDYTSSIPFIGKGVRGWGQPIEQSLFWVMQNFANTVAPANPAVGQLWYDTRENFQLLKLWNGTGWVPASNIIVASDTQPYPDGVEGQLWFDSTNKQLRIMIDGVWSIVGPLGSSINTDPIDSPTPDHSVVDAVRISDTHGVKHQCFRITVGGVTVAIISKSPVFTPASTAYNAYGFPKIYPGITVSALDGTTFAGDPYVWNGRLNNLPEFDKTINIGSKTKRISNVFAYGAQISGNLFSTGTTYFGPSTNTSKPVVFGKTTNLPAVTPRLGAIEFDGSTFYFTNMVQGQPTRQVPVFNQDLSLSRRLYVSLSGSDEASGLSPGLAKKTLKGALAASVAGDTIFIESGEFWEQNPLYVPPYISIIGDNLRRTIIRPIHNQLDLFHVDVGTYFFGMTFKDHRFPSHAFSFPCSTANAVITSGSVTSVQWMYSKTGYTILPDVIVEAPPLGGTTAVINAGPLVDGAIVDVKVTSGGANYTSPPLVTALGNGGTGTGASFRARIDLEENSSTYQKVVAIDILDPGTGYQAPVTFSFSGGAGTGVAATATLGDGVIRGYSIVSGGSGYYRPPHLSIKPPALTNITSSPYVQNCSSITGPFDKNGRLIIRRPGITGDPATGWVTRTDPGTPFAELDPSGAGGGLRVDGDLLSPSSVLRSFVADAFTQVNQGGIGHLLINKGYAQFVSCFTTFSSIGYWARSGGFANISNSVVDFGDVGLQAEGYYHLPYEEGILAATYTSGVGAVLINVGDGGAGYTPGSTFTITFSGGGGFGATGKAFVDVYGAVTRVQITAGGSGYTSPPTPIWLTGTGITTPVGTVELKTNTSIRVTSSSAEPVQPTNASVVKIGGVFYTVISSNPRGTTQWDVAIYPGLPAGTAGDTVSFHDVSNISTGGLALEYVGSGVTYNALPRYGGVPIADKQVVDQDSPSPLGPRMKPGRVYFVTIDNTGNFKIGRLFAVNFVDGSVKLNSNAINLSGLSGIGPFRRDGVIVGTYADEISDDDTLTHSAYTAWDSTTLTTQNAVRNYFTKISTVVTPELNNVYDMGIDSLRWNNVWANTLNANTLNVDLTKEQIVQGLGFTPVQQGTGTNQLNNDIKIGWNGTRLLLQVDDVDFGSQWPIGIGGLGNDLEVNSLGVGLTPYGTAGSLRAVTINTETIAASTSININSNLLSTAGDVINLGYGGRGTVNTNCRTVIKGEFVRQPTNPGNDSNLTFNTSDAIYRMGIGAGTSGTLGFVHSGITSGGARNIVEWNLVSGACLIKGDLNVTGDITAFYGSSDERLKENIKPINNALDKVAQIRGVEFDWTDDYIAKKNDFAESLINKHDVGVIAQEVEKVLPEVVTDREDGYKAVKYDKIIPLLIEAIKDLKAEVESLKQQISKE